MDKDSKIAGLTLLAIPTVVVLFLVILIPIGLFNAWAVQKLYGWFALPLHAPHINLAEVWGLGLIIQHYMPTPDTDGQKYTKTIGRILGATIGTLLALLLGYILKSHIGVY